MTGFPERRRAGIPTRAFVPGKALLKPRWRTLNRGIR